MWTDVHRPDRKRRVHDDGVNEGDIVTTMMEMKLMLVMVKMMTVSVHVGELHGFQCDHTDIGLLLGLQQPAKDGH